MGASKRLSAEGPRRIPNRIRTLVLGRPNRLARRTAILANTITTIKMMIHWGNASMAPEFFPPHPDPLPPGERGYLCLSRQGRGGYFRPPHQGEVKFSPLPSREGMEAG